MLSLVLGVVLAASPPSANDAASIYKQAKASVVKIESEESIGSGFVVGSGDLVLTCEHVSRGAGLVRVISGSSSQTAMVVYQDRQRDVSVLRLTRKLSKALALNSGSAPGPGSKVFVIGNPLGFLDRTITEGIVGGVRKLGYVNLVQISAPISPGSSGSPVLDERGRVIGMAKGTISEGQNVNFAVSAYDLRLSLDAAQNVLLLVKSKQTLVGSKADARAVKKNIGVLGRATGRTSIYASASPTSRVYYRVKEYEYLVVQKYSSKEWLKVLLQNGKFGYVPSKAIQVFDVSVFAWVVPRESAPMGIASPESPVAKPPIAESPPVTDQRELLLDGVEPDESNPYLPRIKWREPTSRLDGIRYITGISLEEGGKIEPVVSWDDIRTKLRGFSGDRLWVEVKLNSGTTMTLVIENKYPIK
ncbi:MAG TPA: serine protease [Fimbriimonadaceae bacterium]|nr:serine protease [Fimbriimonadaceae bacterium]